MIWIADASPIIFLATVGLADLLLELPEELVIPLSVAKEVRSLPARKWLEESAASAITKVFVSGYVESLELGAGETAVLELALNRPRSVALIDDRQARTEAIRLRISVMGTVGILTLARKRGLITALNPILEELQASSLRISAQLIRRALDEVGE